MQVDDEDLARQGGDQEEKGAEKEDLKNHDREERLQIPGEVVGSNAGVVGPGGQRAEEFAEEQPGESEDRGYERAGPAAAQVSDLRNGLSE